MDPGSLPLDNLGASSPASGSQDAGGFRAKERRERRERKGPQPNFSAHLPKTVARAVGDLDADELAGLFHIYDPESTGSIGYDTFRDLVRFLYARDSPHYTLPDEGVDTVAGIFGLQRDGFVTKERFMDKFNVFWRQRKYIQDKFGTERRWQRRLSMASDAGSTIVDPVEIPPSSLVEAPDAPFDFRPGEVYEALSWLQMSAEEDPDSADVLLLAPRSRMRLVKIGATNVRRFYVLEQQGQDGWVSVTNEQNKLLIGPLKPFVDSLTLEDACRDAVADGADIVSELVSAHRHALDQAVGLWACEAELHQARRVAAQLDFSGRDLAVEELCADVTNKLRATVMSELLDAQRLRTEATVAADEALSYRKELVTEETALRDQLRMLDAREKHLMVVSHSTEQKQQRFNAKEHSLDVQEKTQEAFRQEVLEAEQNRIKQYEGRSEMSIRANMWEYIKNGEKRVSDLELELQQEVAAAAVDRRKVTQERETVTRESLQAQLAATESMEIYERAVEDRQRVEEAMAGAASGEAPPQPASQQLAAVAAKKSPSGAPATQVEQEMRMWQQRFYEEANVCQGLARERDYLRRELREMTRISRSGVRHH
eukprot:TRINITY_DN72093_c0_g2_i1.p1 TRINITY_DN72093_c0_g2~~TRINITY_DN72093_c0_g2_i1.p1  ORF type:complete len:599 (+),score=164.77 TRINITY_DN72093_c0_g2_i1:99-1895(+)